MVNKNQKGFTGILILLIILSLVALVGISYFFGVNKINTNLTVPTSTPAASVLPTTDPTVSWKTYTNTTYGFNFKYPNDLVIKKDMVSTDGSIEFNNFVFLLEKTEPVDILISHVNSLKDTNGIAPTIKTINEFEAVEWIGSYKNEPTHYISILNKGAVYNFGITDTDDMTTFVSAERKLLDQILSTFKFVDAKESSKTQSYVAPPTWIKVTTKDGLKLCLPPKWESKNGYGELIYNRDSSYKPTITTIQNIPYNNGSITQAYYDYWKAEYPNASQLLMASDIDINGNNTQLFNPKGESKSSPEGVALVWYASGKLWKAGLSNWNMINSSKSEFLNDFYKMVSCSF